MKPLLAGIILLLASSISHAIDFSQSPYDKATHITIGAFASCAVTYGSKNPWYGFFTGILIGTVKEATDKNWDNADFVSWGVGGAVGTLCIRLD